MGRIDHAGYTAGGSDHTVAVTVQEMDGGRIAASFTISETPGSVPVTKVLLYDSVNVLLDEKTENILMKEGIGILYRFIIDVKQA